MTGVQFPITAEEFALLRNAGKTVIYCESEEPPGPEWSKWGERVIDGQVVTVWRTIVTLDEAVAFES